MEGKFFVNELEVDVTLQNNPPVFLDEKAEAFWDKIERKHKREQGRKSKPLTKSQEKFWSQFTPIPEEEAAQYQPKPDMFDKGLRALGQIGIGAAEMIPWNVMWEALKGLGKLSQQGNFIEARQDDPDLNYDYFKKGSDQALSWLPTVSNAVDKIDQYTDLDLHPQNELEKVLRIAGSAGVNGQGLLNKIIQGATGAGIYEGSKSLGAPEVLSEILGITGGNIIPNLSKGTIQKYPSGLTRRNIEKIKRSRKLTEAQKNKLLDTIKKDTLEQAEEILSKNNSFYNEYKAHPHLIEKAEEDMNLVAEYLSKESPQRVPSDVLNNKIRNYMSQQKLASIGLDEGQRHYLSEMGKFIKESEKKGTLSTKQLLDQYRKNNSLFKQVINKEASSLKNQAAQQVILDQNEAIKSVLQDIYHNDPIMDKFLESNKLYGNVKDTDKITSSLESVFSSSKPTHQAQYLLRNKTFQESLKKTYGTKTATEMNQLLTDLSDVTKNLSKIKQTQLWGAGEFFLHQVVPFLQKGHLAAKSLFWLRNNMLKNPKKYREWEKLVKAIKTQNLPEIKRYSKLLEPTFKALVRVNKEDN